MKVIIAGSRGILEPLRHVYAAVHGAGFDITEVVSGTARGIDRAGEEFAKNHKLPVARFPADWEKHGRSAGYKRNKQMAEYADALIAVWDGESRGTKNMIEEAEKAGLAVSVYTTPPGK